MSYPAASFANESNTVDPALGRQLSAIARNNPVTLSLHQRWGDVFRVRFWATGFGEKEAVLDPTAKLVFFYRAAPQTLYSQQLPSDSIISHSIANALTTNM